MPYFINGIFFQQKEGLELGLDPLDGVAVFVTNNLVQFPFAGYFQTDPKSVLKSLTGWISDVFGDARITNIQISEGALEFDKRYTNTNADIHYSFRKLPDGTWIGTYEHPGAGIGASRCVLIEVSESFFDAQETERLTGLVGLHQWSHQAL